MRAPQRTSELDRGKLSSRIPTREGSRQRHPISLCELPLYHAPKPDQGGRCTSGYSGPVLLWFSNFPISSVPGGNSSARNLSRVQLLHQGRVTAGSRGNNSHQFLQQGHSSLERWSPLLQGYVGRCQGHLWAAGAALQAPRHGMGALPMATSRCRAGEGWCLNLALPSAWKP